MNKKETWNFEKAKKIALKNSIKMTKKHWKIILLMRNFYKKYNVTPSVRMLTKYFKKNKFLINSQELFVLFPKGLIKQASKIAGLPEPKNCI